MTRPGVLCAGSVIVDVAKVIDAYPERDRLAMIDEVSTSTGGPALNMAVDLARLGAPFPVAVAGVVGADDHGDLVLRACAELGIDTAGLARRDDLATSFTDAMVERHGGRRTFFHHPGANDAFDGSLVPVAATSARILHVGAPGIHAAMDAATAAGNGWSDLLARARRAGLWTTMELVTLTSQRQVELVGPCLPELDSLVINELEAAALLEVAPPADPGADWDAVEQLATGLVGRGVRRLAVVHFPAGAVAAGPDGATWRQGSVRLSDDRVVSTTGAGDAFAAGVLFGTHEGWPVPDRLRLGVAAAAACVQARGTSDGVHAAGTCLAEADTVGYRATGRD